MELYTKCDRCHKELEVIDFKTNQVENGVYLNNKILCIYCSKKEKQDVIESICNNYNLNHEKYGTYIKDGILYLQYSLGAIDKDYYGINDYSFVVDTFTLIPYINFNDVLFELKNINKESIMKIIELVEFMCD